MRALPFAIGVRSPDSTLPVQQVVCRRSLRLLVRRRETFEASWQDRAVILKVFGHPWKARLHARRERRGFERLAQRGIPVPAVLLYGRTDDGRWAVVTEKIEGAISLLEACTGQGAVAQRDAALGLAGCELARLHERGVLQQDLHPVNFLVRNDRLIVLDPGQIRFLSHPVGRTICLRQLAHLACALVNDDRPEAIERLCAAYAQTRHWSWGRAEQVVFRRRLRRERREKMRLAARRPLRKGRDHVRTDIRAGRAVVDKGFFQLGPFVDLAENLDARLDSGLVLRRDAVELVSAFSWGSQEIVATRFDERGWRRTLSGWLRGGLARRRWNASRQLRAMAIATARPLALIERKEGRFQRRSYLLTESVQGRSLREFLSDRQIAKERKGDVIRQVFAVLDRLARYGVSCGRIELADILVREDRPVFTVRDDVVIHLLDACCQRRHRMAGEGLAKSLAALGLDPPDMGGYVQDDTSPQVH